MSGYNGDILLNVFDDLNIHHDGISPNVIRAWFDTDDKDMQNLLTWMCTSLSKNNFVSTMELQEFEEIQDVDLSGDHEKLLSSVHAEYPDVFDFNENRTEIELLESESELLKEEEIEASHLLNNYEDLYYKLSRELANTTTKYVKMTEECQEMQEIGEKLAMNLDELNEELLLWVSRYAVNLHDFQFGQIPKFTNSIDLREFEDIVSNLSNLILNRTNDTTISSLSISKHQFLDAFSDLQKRILHAHKKYLASKIEVKQKEKVLKYLKDIDTASFFFIQKKLFIEDEINGKEQQIILMNALMNEISPWFASLCVNGPVMKHRRLQLQQCKKELHDINDLTNFLKKMWHQFIILLCFHMTEKKDIDASDMFFRKILKHTRSLEACLLRIENMENIIEEAKSYNNCPIKDKCNLIKSIAKIVTNNEFESLESTLEAIYLFKIELSDLEKKIFIDDFNNDRELAKEMNNNMNVLNHFLVSGPTHRLVTISPEMFKVINEVNYLIEKQIRVVQNAVATSGNMQRVTSNKWLNYRRQLWKYFLADQQKMFLILQQAKEHFESSNQ